MVIFSVANIFFNKPATGKILNPSLSDNPVSQPVTGQNVITTKYFSLNYDAGLDTVSNISSDDNTSLEAYRLARSDVNGRRKLVVTIKDLPDGGLSEESSYKFRSINPQQYRESSKNYGDNSFVLVEKLDGTELTAFSVSGDKLAMLAYTVDVPGTNVTADSADLISSFKWNQ